MTSNLQNFTDAWLDQLEAYLDVYNNKGGFPMRHNTIIRSLNWCALPILCAPCCIWSTMWRLMCCPFVCFAKGAGYMCSDNGCTSITDKCMVAYVEDTTALKRMPPLPQTWTELQKIRLETLLCQLERIFKIVNAYDKIHYKLAEACFDTNPAMVLVNIREIRAKLMIR